MENRYLKGFVARDWCTKNVHFKSYFEKYSNALNDTGLMDNKMSEIEILHKIVPQSSSSSKAELTKLMAAIDPKQFTKLSNENLERKPKKVSQQDPSTSFKLEANTDSQQSLDERKKIRNRLQVCSLTQRKEVPVDPSEMAGRKDLIPNKNYLVSFRIHERFTHARVKGRPGRCMQEIVLLGHQPLVHLRDKIICGSDYMDVKADISENPDLPLHGITKDKYPSSMFYLGNTFYIDTRKETNVDYSYAVKEWGRKLGVDLNGTRPMEEATVDELVVRLGYPYLFMHQGCCEHLIIINDARLLSNNDSLCSTDYPMMTKVTKEAVHYCMTCSRFPARWIVTDGKHLAHDPSYQCKVCFRMFNYKNGKKVCKFKAYKYIQPSFM